MIIKFVVYVVNNVDNPSYLDLKRTWIWLATVPLSVQSLEDGEERVQSVKLPRHCPPPNRRPLLSWKSTKQI